MATFTIRRGGADDAARVLALSDEAVVGLVGARLVAAAAQEARDAGAALLRVDCWAGAPPLVAWYERQGFQRTGTFDVGGWIGQVFAMRL